MHRTFRKVPAPTIDTRFWSLGITGLVRHPYILTYDELLNLPAEEHVTVTACAAVRPDLPLMRESVWRGVPLRALMYNVERAPHAAYATLYAADGYNTVVPLDALQDSLLAYTVDGETLTIDEGFPARLIIPGLYGYKQPKWIRHIELTAQPVPGYWEAHGWPLDGVVQPIALIDVPATNARVAGAVTIAGRAHAGAARIERVELCINRGDWLPVIVDDHDPGRVASWSFTWMPPHRGSYLLHIRAFDSHGRSQQDTGCGRLIYVEQGVL